MDFYHDLMHVYIPVTGADSHVAVTPGCNRNLIFLKISMRFHKEAQHAEIFIIAHMHTVLCQWQITLAGKI